MRIRVRQSEKLLHTPPVAQECKPVTHSFQGTSKPGTRAAEAARLPAFALDLCSTQFHRARPRVESAWPLGCSQGEKKTLPSGLPAVEWCVVDHKCPQRHRFGNRSKPSPVQEYQPVSLSGHWHVKCANQTPLGLPLGSTH